MRPVTIILNQPNSNVCSFKLENFLNTYFNLTQKITSLAVNEGVNSLAAGLSGGEVFYYKNDILKYKNEKPRILHEAPHSITALAFKNINKFTLIYLATEHTIITITLGGKDKDEKV